MDTLLKTHNKIQFLHPVHGLADKVSAFTSSRPQNLESKFHYKKSHIKLSKNFSVKASANALLELVPEIKKENLDFELPLYDPSKGLVVDLAVVGGGPAGLAVAQQVSEAGLSVCSIDPCPKLIWPNNYGVWVDEFEAMDLLDCLDTTWSGAVVYIDEKTTKDLGRPYGRVNRKQLKSKMMMKCISNGVKFHQAKVVKVIHEESKSFLICNDGVTIQASVVLDATGFSRCLVQYDKPYNPGYQVAYGILAEVEEHPFDVEKMVFMDWRDSHLRNNEEMRERNRKIPTFLYAMPFSKQRIFLEETSLVARPGVPMKDIQERMVARLSHLGIKVKSIEEDEHCVIPMGGPLPVLPQRVVGIGGTAGMVHPSTGYMVARTLAAAPIVANAIVGYLGSDRVIQGNNLSAEVWKDLWPIERRRQREFFCFGMDILLKLELQSTRRFFDAFFNLEPRYWHGFLSSRLFLPELLLFGLSLFANASNASRLEIMAKGTPSLMHVQDDFQDVTTYFRRFRNPSWLEVVSRDIIDKRIRIGLVKMDRVVQDVPARANKNITTYFKEVKNPGWFEAIRREFKVGKINIGLVNTGELMNEIWTKAIMVDVHFEHVGEDIKWSDLAPERVYENSTCPDIPMPILKNYKDLDVVIARVPHSIDDEGGGSKDVFRLQLNLMVANLLVRSGRNGSGPLMAVFVESEPMWEIFRCDDLFWNEGNTWIYKPEMTMIKKLALMPVGPCQFVPPSSMFGDDQQLWKKETSHHLQPREAYVTVLHTTEDYVCGAIVLAQSIIQSNTTKDLILFADNTISAESIAGLQAAGWKTERIERIRSPYSRKDSYNEWNYSKLRIWQLKQYEKLMFIDADLLVVRNLDEFFAYPQLSAAGNYQKHLFNSGLMIVEPSQCTFDILMKKMMVVESYNGGDQGFLNEMFPWWHRLPHELNFMKVFIEQNDTEHVIVDEFYALHYTGLKPWTCPGERDCNWDVPEFHRYASDFAHGMWWGVYRGMAEKLKPYCSQNRSSI